MTLSSDEERSGSVVEILDLRLKGLKLETHRRQCVVFLSKTLVPLLSTGSTQENRKSSRHDYMMLLQCFNVDWTFCHSPVIDGVQGVCTCFHLWIKKSSSLLVQ